MWFNEKLTWAEIIGPPLEYKYGCNNGKRTLNQLVIAEIYTTNGCNYIEEETEIKVIRVNGLETH